MNIFYRPEEVSPFSTHDDVTSQQDGEPVSDYIRSLEQLFRLAYGSEGMSEETRETLLHSQLQEGLRYDLMKAPAVSGSHAYKELCLAARNEEKRLAELAKRRQYIKPMTGPGRQPSRERISQPQDELSKHPREQKSGEQCKRVQCYSCQQVSHFVRDSQNRRNGWDNGPKAQSVGTKQIQTTSGEFGRFPPTPQKNNNTNPEDATAKQTQTAGVEVDRFSLISDDVISSLFPPESKDNLQAI